MSAFTGTGALARLALRRERWWLPGSLAVFVGIDLSTIGAMRDLVPTLSARQDLAATVAASPAFAVLLGPFDHPDTLAGTVSWRVGLFMTAALAILAALTVVRHTRREEDAGRLELVGAARTGRLAPLAAAVGVAALLCLAVAVGAVVTLLSAGSDPAPALGVGAQRLAVGLAAVGLAAVAAQVGSTGRAATGIAVGAILLGYLLRGVADARESVAWLRWSNPLGWSQAIDPYGGPTWWPALLIVASAVGMGVLAGWLRVRRDLGSGLVRPRDGAPGGRHLVSVEALVWRLERRQLAAWAMALAFFGAFVGSLQPSMADFTDSIQGFREMIARLGGEGALTKGYQAAMAGFFGIAVASWAMTVLTGLRADEVAGRAETVLATATSRARHVLASVGFVVLGSVVLLAVSGLAAGLAGATMPDAVLAQVVQAPAVWAVAGAAVVAYGLGSRWLVWGWILVAWSFVVGQLGAVLDLPDWLSRLSPFEHVPKVPQESWAWPPVMVLTLVAVALVSIGLVLFRRRDLPG